MKYAIVALVAALVASGATYMLMSGQQKGSASPSAAGIMKFNCEQSGGTFADGSCGCKGATYEASTGYCIDAFGAPGGELGNVARKLQELKMLQSK